MMLLEVADLHVYYGKSYILRGVSLRVGRDEVVALLGRNGAGKTTTLKTIMGLLRQARGRVVLDGVDLGNLPPFRRARQGLGYVPQDRLLFGALTVGENLRSAMGRRREGQALEMVHELFPVLKERSTQTAGTLSGGEQQMLAIARALLTGPRILLLDEPSTGLMPGMVARLADVIRKLNGAGISVLLVEEKIPLALELAHRIYVVDVGSIVHESDAAGIRAGDVLVRYLGVSDG